MTKIKLSKREMMVEAHKMAKQMVGDYVARLALALRTLWAAAKKGVAKVMKNEKKIKYHVNYLNANCKPLHNDNAEVGTKIIVAVVFGEFEGAEIKSIKTLSNGNKQIRYATVGDDHLYTMNLLSLETIEKDLRRAGRKPDSFISN